MARVNIPILFLSIVLSTFLWIVRFGQDLTTSGTVPVKLKPTNVISLSSKLSVIDIPAFQLKLAGPAEEVARAQTDLDADTSITVNLSGGRAGKFYYPLAFAPSIKRIVLGPKSIPVEIEDVVTKDVPVKVVPKGKLSDPNSTIESFPTSENTATITAPKSVADQITKVRAVLDVGEINAENPKPEKIVLVPVDDTGKTYDASIDPLQVTVTPIVTAASVQKQVVVSPTINGAPAVGYIPVGATTTPKEITISGPTSILVNHFSVKTESIDVSGLTATKWFEVKPILPAGTTSNTKIIHIRYDIAVDPAVKRAKTAATTALTPTNTTAGTPH